MEVRAGDTTSRRLISFGRTPIERAVADQVDEGLEHGDREDHRRAEAEATEITERDGVREEEDDLDVEDDEDHRDQVEANREAMRRLAARDDAALVRRHLGRGGPRRNEKTLGNRG